MQTMPKWHPSQIRKNANINLPAARRNSGNSGTAKGHKETLDESLGQIKLKF